jgi:hypothetical protein
VREGATVVIVVLECCTCLTIENVTTLSPNHRHKVVDDCSYVRHSPAYKPERKPLRGVCGSYLRQSWNVEMASSLQRVEKNSR